MDMIGYTVAGPVPVKLLEKATALIQAHDPKNCRGWKKINGLRSWSSFRLNDNYRVLRSEKGLFVVCNHDIYEKKIRTFKKRV